MISTSTTMVMPEFAPKKFLMIFCGSMPSTVRLPLRSSLLPKGPGVVGVAGGMFEETKIRRKELFPAAGS